PGHVDLTAVEAGDEPEVLVGVEDLDVTGGHERRYLACRWTMGGQSPQEEGNSPEPQRVAGRAGPTVSPGPLPRCVRPPRRHRRPRRRGRRWASGGRAAVVRS